MDSSKVSIIKIVVWNFAGVCIFVVEERHNKVFNRSKELGVYT